MVTGPLQVTYSSLEEQPWTDIGENAFPCYLQQKAFSFSSTPTSRWALTTLPTNINETNDSTGIARNASCLHGCLCSGNYHGKHTSDSIWKCHQFWSIIFFPSACSLHSFHLFAEMGSHDLICWAIIAAHGLTWSSGNWSPGDNQYLRGKLHQYSNCRRWKFAVTAKCQWPILLFLKQTLERISVL